MPAVSFVILVLGTLSTFSSHIITKSLLYSAGIVFFLIMVILMNKCISEASSGEETLLHGTSFLRGLCIIILLTWFPFPIWYALSPEGFGILNNVGGMKIA